MLRKGGTRHATAMHVILSEGDNGAWQTAFMYSKIIAILNGGTLSNRFAVG